jgi:ribosomal RNA-processing protein 12
MILGLVGEILLCLKDANAKTRDAAYKLLLSMSSVQDDVTVVIRSVTAALASKTSQMRSAAVAALSRLVFEFASDCPSVQEVLPSLLKTVLLLSDDPSREVVKSLVGFVRVSIAALTPDQLRPLLSDILSSLLNYHRGKDRFRAKIKIILKKLVRLFGFDALMPFVPDGDVRLLTHMRKLSERDARRKKQNHNKKSVELSRFDAMVASDEEDSDDGRTLFSGATGVSRMTNRSGRQITKRRHGDRCDDAILSVASNARTTVKLKNDVTGNYFDMKDLRQKEVRFAETPSADSDSDGPVQFDGSGKLIVTDDLGEASLADQTASNLASRRVQADVGGGDSFQREKTKKSKGKATQTGLSYKAKKAGGDVKKKGQKYDPYAFVPLDGRIYTRKNRHRAVEQMSEVVQRGNKRQRR